jgi:ribonuclease H2 subunit C
MLAIKSGPQAPSTVTANLLPCRIHHDGPISLSDHHWSPLNEPATTSTSSETAKNTITEETKDEACSSPSTKLTAYFRGRRLLGRSIAIPEGYNGSVLRITKDVLQKPGPPVICGEEDDHEEEEEITTYVAEEQSKFDKIIVWGHEVVADEAEDQYIRGVEEWIGFAESIHSE